MNTRDFLTTLVPYRTHALVFEVGSGRIKPGYHVTEIKAVSVQGVDCGGQADAWAETVIQLWTPNTADETYMSVGKFLSIFRRVASQLSVNDRAEVRLEYGDSDDQGGAPAISYLVEEIQIKEEVVVRLKPPFVACKVLGRLSLDTDNAANDLPVITTASECCTPTTPMVAQNAAKRTTCCG